METGANPKWVLPMRSAICKVVAFAVVTLISQLAFGEKSMPPVGDKHFCEWWQAKIGSPSHPGIPPSESADSGSRAPVTPELRASFERFTTPEPVDPEGVRTLDGVTVTAAIGCLLQLEPNVQPANYMGVTWGGVSQTFDWAPVNLAALYYISYLYTGNWKHGNAIALRGPGAESSRSRKYATTQLSIHRAYRSYRRWYEQVQEVGLDEARAEKLDPLAGTSLYWY